MRLSFSILILSLLITLSCQRGQDLAGNYTGAVPSGEKMEVRIVLKSDGKGAWKVNRDEVSFFWEQKGDEILLHLKSGGVITGRRVSKDSLEVSLPGMEQIRFIRTGK